MVDGLSLQEARSGYGDYGTGSEEKKRERETDENYGILNMEQSKRSVEGFVRLSP